MEGSVDFVPIDELEVQDLWVADDLNVLHRYVSGSFEQCIPVELESGRSGCCGYSRPCRRVWEREIMNRETRTPGGVMVAMSKSIAVV